MDEIDGMKDCRNSSEERSRERKRKLTSYAFEELLSEALDVTEWKGVVRVLLEEVEDGGGE